MDEDLDKWFKEKWVNIGKKVDGKHPPCGTSGEKKGYAKCVPAAKAASMSKKEKESATKRKRAAQNKAGRGGKDSSGQGKKPIYVSTKPKRENMNIEEKLNLFLEKNCPTDPGKWSASKSAAKSKFDVYPSAYANGWAAKNYKSKGGGWRKCNEGEVNGLCEYGNDNFSAPQPDFDKYDAVSNPNADPSKTLTGRFTDPSVGLNEACWEGYKQVGMKDKGGRQVPNCVPIEEETIIEFSPIAGASIGKAIHDWISTVSGWVASGTLTPVQGVVVGFGVPAVLATGYDRADHIVNSVKQFARDIKDKQKINPEQTKELVTRVVAATKELPKGKQKHLAKMMRTHQDAVTSGDKGKILSAQRDLKTYANKQIDQDNLEQDKLHRATSKKAASAAEKRVAPVGAKHAGWGRWTDANGKTLGYTRDGKWVPAQQKIENIEELHEGEFCKACLKEYILEHANVLTEAEYHGRKVSIGKPMRGDVKKFKVFVKDPSTGNVKKVNFGDPNMRIKKSNPARRKSFRARHKCHTAKDRTSARYWSCRAW